MPSIEDRVRAVEQEVRFFREELERHRTEEFARNAIAEQNIRQVASWLAGLIRQLGAPVPSAIDVLERRR
jgi:hypothetical protein